MPICESGWKSSISSLRYFAVTIAQDFGAELRMSLALDWTLRTKGILCREAFGVRKLASAVERPNSADKSRALQALARPASRPSVQEPKVRVQFGDREMKLKNPRLRL